MKKWTQCTIGMLLAVLLAGVGTYGIKTAKPLASNISLLCAEKQMTLARASEIRKNEQEREEIIAFTVWNEQRQRLVKDEDGYRAAYANVLELNGSSELLLPYGKILHEDDREGCLLGRKTAEKLFGIRNVEGLTVRFGTRELTIRGVLKEPQELMVLQAVDEDTCFERIAIERQSGITGKRTAEQFAGKYGLRTEQLRYNLVSGEHFLELIPGKWSDFDGWKQSFDKLGREVRLLCVTEKSSVEYVYLEKSICGIYCVAAGALCAVFGLREIWYTKRIGEYVSYD